MVLNDFIRGWEYCLKHPNPWNATPPENCTNRRDWCRGYNKCFSENFASSFCKSMTNGNAQLSHRRWVPEEEEILRKYYPKIDDVCSRLNRTRGAVRQRARLLGLKKNQNVRWSVQEEEILRKCYPEKGVNIPELKHRTKSAIKSRAFILGVKKLT